MLVQDNAYRSYGLDVVSPSTILERAQIVDVTIENINSDVATSPPANSAVLRDWLNFYSSWKNFYSNLGGVSGWLDRLWGNAMTQVDQYQTQANMWRQTLLSAGAGIVTPESTVTESSIFPVKTLVWGAVALGGLYIAGKLLDIIPKGKR